jgi:hypothetical protein
LVTFIVGQVATAQGANAMLLAEAGQLRVVDNTTHYIQSQRPQAVVDAVEELAGRARGLVGR